MTKSQSSEDNSCFGLWCSRCCHSDNCAAENTAPVIIGSIRLHLEASESTTELQMWKKEELCDSYDILSLFVYRFFVVVFFFLYVCPSLSLPPPFCQSFSVPVSAPAPSLCPRWLPDEGKLMPEFIVGARAPASTTRLLCSAVWRRGLLL